MFSRAPSHPAPLASRSSSSGPLLALVRAPYIARDPLPSVLVWMPSSLASFGLSCLSVSRSSTAVWVLGEKPPQGRVRKTFVFSSRRVPVPIVFGVGSLVSPSVDATPYPLTSFLVCCVGPASCVDQFLSLSGVLRNSALSVGLIRYSASGPDSISFFCLCFRTS